jgi:MFS family permease
MLIFCTLNAVPIIPDYLYSLDSSEGAILLPTSSENSKVGVLLCSKAFVQFFANPALGIVIHRVGYRLPLLIGSVLLLVTSLSKYKNSFFFFNTHRNFVFHKRSIILTAMILVFAWAEAYVWLLVARSVHGLASATIAVSGAFVLTYVFFRNYE